MNNDSSLIDENSQELDTLDLELRLPESLDTDVVLLSPPQTPPGREDVHRPSHEATQFETLRQLMVAEFER
jgi:hypothetical protein